MIVEGETPATMAKSTGLGLLELPTIFENLKPDIVISVGDRFETMATAVAAAYMNIPVAHTMGGEISGTIDESIRHAVTKLAHVHFPPTSRRPRGSSAWAKTSTACTSSAVRASISCQQIMQSDGNSVRPSGWSVKAQARTSRSTNHSCW
jgi:hypothetical protein